MAELLTESFCERCGTRYTFESAAPRRRLRGIKTLGSGLRTFVLSNDVSLDEAMAAARSDAERESSAHQLDAFHKTFSFCMTCRQYTCGDCWNGVEGRCLTCAPDPTRGALAASFDLPAVAPVEATVDEVLSPIAPEPSEEPAWPVEASWAVAPEGDVEVEMAAIEVTVEVAAVEAEPEPAVEGEPTFDEASDLLARISGHAAEAPTGIAAVAEAPEPEPEVDVAAFVAEPEPEAETLSAEPVSPTPASSDDAAHRATGRTSALLARFRPGQSLDAAIAEYEAGLEPVEATIAPTAAVEPEPEQAEPEPVAAIEAAAEVTVEPAVEPLAPSVTDSVPQPVWQAPEPRPANEAAPQWPTGPRWPTSIPARGPAPRPSAPVDPLTALLAREASDRMWAASNAELTSVPAPAAANVPSVHECTSCGLSLSATARFCRRCGTRQDG